MATMLPPKPVPGTPESEFRVYEGLRQLDDDWTVLHSVTWQSVRDGRQGDGEADFVLLHPQFGIVILEVKGGELEVRDGCWYSSDRAGRIHEIKNPFDQAKSSKYALLRYLQAVRPRLSVPKISHAVVFPRATVTDNIGLYGPRAIILDRADLADVPAAVNRIVNHWEQKARLSHDDLLRIRDLLAPTVQIRLRLKDRVSEARDAIIELTNRQIDAFAQLRLMRRLLVLGPAGSGKTILAMERARQLAEEGYSVLFLCFNKLLAEYLSSQMSDIAGVRTTTFHSLCMHEIRNAKLTIPTELDDAWWMNNAPTLLEEAWTRNGRDVGAIVVDEGQDFSPEWLMTAMMLLKDLHDGPFFVFADSNQEVYAGRWSMPEDMPRVPLDVNCRNTAQIANRVSVFLDGRCDTLGVEGPEPVFIPWSGAGSVTGIVQEVVQGLIEDEGMERDEIAVLADQRHIVDRLHEMLAGDAVFTAWGGHGVVAETVHRFKGLEADVIVLVLSGDWSDRSQQIEALAYVGMSRARTALYVIGTEDARRTLGWDTTMTID